MAILLDEVRRRILIGLFADDELMDILVFKGGNALALVHKVGSRASFDMDFSIEAAFAELDRAGARIFDALGREFGSIGYVVFDTRFQPKPSVPGTDQPEWWGGYSATFKLVQRVLYEEFKHDMHALRMRAEELGPAHKRSYTIDISRHEFCEGKQQREVDDYVVYVYSLEMIAAEKLRAICQQMQEYPFNQNKTPRARDFYDIHQIITENGIDLTTHDNCSTLVAIFAAKRVELSLLREMDLTHDFHAEDWPAVTASVAGRHEDFDYYFDSVVRLASDIVKALGIK